MNKLSYIKSINADYIEQLYQRYLADPASIDDSWRFFFEGIELAGDTAVTSNGHANGHSSGPGAQVVSLASAQAASGTLNTEAKVGELIQTYRELGLHLANINPLEPARKTHPFLELSNFNLTEADLDKKFTAAKLMGLPTSSLREIIAALRETYCSTIGVQYSHIQDKNVRTWLETRMESSRNKATLSK